MPLLNGEALLRYIEQIGKTEEVQFVVFLFLRAGGEIFVEREGDPEGNLLKNLHLHLMPDDAGRLLMGTIMDKPGVQIHGFLDYVVVNDPQRERRITIDYLRIIIRKLAGGNSFTIKNIEGKLRV